MRKRKFWGWGYEDELLSDEEENNIDKRIANTFNLDSVDRIKIPDIKSIDLPKPRVQKTQNLKIFFQMINWNVLIIPMENLSLTPPDQF